MMSRMARTAAMTVLSLKSKAERKVRVPRNRSEMCGNFFCGCTRAKTRKKFPSSAAEYGTREYPSNEENTEAKAIQRTMAVEKRAAPEPYSFSTKALTMKGESWACCHGNTPRMLVCMARYRMAMPIMEMKMPRGILRAGSRISPPRWQML